MEIKQVDKLQTLAASDELKAAGELSQARQNHSKQQGQLDQLIGFRQEYEDKVAATTNGGLSVRQFMDHRVFLEKLNAAISQQQTEIAHVEKTVQGHEQEWLDRYQRKKVLENLSISKQKALTQQEQKQEAKKTDELNLQRHT